LSTAVFPEAVGPKRTKTGMGGIDIDQKTFPKTRLVRSSGLAGKASKKTAKSPLFLSKSTNPAPERGYGCFGKVFVSGYIPFLTPQGLPRELVSGFLGMYPSHTIKASLPKAKFLGKPPEFEL
jgi:hypothetical protein